MYSRMVCAKEDCRKTGRFEKTKEQGVVRCTACGTTYGNNQDVEGVPIECLRCGQCAFYLGTSKSTGRLEARCISCGYTG